MAASRPTSVSRIEIITWLNTLQEQLEFQFKGSKALQDEMLALLGLIKTLELQSDPLLSIEEQEKIKNFFNKGIVKATFIPFLNTSTSEVKKALHQILNTLTLSSLLITVELKEDEAQDESKEEKKEDKSDDIADFRKKVALPSELISDTQKATYYRKLESSSSSGSTSTPPSLRSRR